MDAIRKQRVLILVVACHTESTIGDGYHNAIENGFDFVTLLHDDGQFAPECLPQLRRPLTEGGAAAVFGSRVITPKGAIKGGMAIQTAPYAGRWLSASKPYTRRPDV
jgi:hypothetical protein